MFEDGSSSVGGEEGKKKRKKKKNKKKKKNGADSISEVSMNDQSLSDLSQSNSTKPGNSRKNGLDFTPLKEKIDDTFFDD